MNPTIARPMTSSKILFCGLFKKKNRAGEKIGKYCPGKYLFTPAPVIASRTAKKVAAADATLLPNSNGATLFGIELPD